jgi:hypothetical protein
MHLGRDHRPSASKLTKFLTHSDHYEQDSNRRCLLVRDLVVWDHSATEAPCIVYIWLAHRVHMDFYPFFNVIFHYALLGYWIRNKFYSILFYSMISECWQKLWHALAIIIFFFKNPVFTFSHSCLQPRSYCRWSQKYRDSVWLKTTMSQRNINAKNRETAIFS